MYVLFYFCQFPEQQLVIEASVAHGEGATNDHTLVLNLVLSCFGKGLHMSTNFQADNQFAKDQSSYIP